MKEPILAKILRYFVYAAAFVPLIIFSEYISPFHFGKVVVLRSMVEIMIVLYLLLIWKDRSYLVKMTKVGWAFLFFACAFSVTTITSTIPYASFWGSLERMGGVFTFWHYFAYFIILTAVFKTEKDWINLFKLLIAVGVVSAFYGFLQKTDLTWVVGSGNRARIFGTIGNAALFAGYQILASFLALTLFFRPGNSDKLRIFYGLSGSIMIIAALVTAVRGSVLAVGVGLLIFALLYSAAYRSKKARKLLLMLIALLAVFVVSALLFKDSSFVQKSGYLKRVTDFSLTSYTVQTRFWAWEAGIRGWKETPKTIIFGWGPENFNIPFSKYFNPKFFQGPGSETLFDRAHNMFVEILVTMGLLGFLTYLWIFGASLKVLWQKIHNKETMLYGVGLISMLVAYAIHNSFIFDTSANFLVFFTILGFISFLAKFGSASRTESNNPVVKNKSVPQRRVNKGAYSLGAAVLFISASISIYYFNVLPSRANYATTRAIIRGWDNDFAGAVKKYQEAIAYDTPGKYEFRHRLAQYVLEKNSSGEISPEMTEVIMLAIAETQKNVEENPQDYLPLLYQARLYVTLGRDKPESEYNDKALELCLRALEISPKFVRTYYEIGQVYLNKKDFDNAAEYFKKAAELNPDVGLSYWYWGIVEIERGNIEGGLAIVEELIKTRRYIPSETDMGRLINIYMQKNDFKSLAWAYEILVSANPKSPQYRASLAVTYARIGRFEDAVEHAREAARLDPTFEAEAREFVQSLGYTW